MTESRKQLIQQRRCSRLSVSSCDARERHTLRWIAVKVCSDKAERPRRILYSDVGNIILQGVGKSFTYDHLRAFFYGLIDKGMTVARCSLDGHKKITGLNRAGVERHPRHRDSHVTHSGCQRNAIQNIFQFDHLYPNVK